MKPSPFFFNVLNDRVHTSKIPLSHQDPAECGEPRVVLTACWTVRRLQCAQFNKSNGPAYREWVRDVKTATEQVDEAMVDRWTLEDVTDMEFHRWANCSGQNQMDFEWSLKHYYLMNAKLVNGAKDIVRAEASKSNIRGARAWKRVQVYAAGLTQNRRAELQSELNNGGCPAEGGAQGPRVGALPAINRHGVMIIGEVSTEQTTENVQNPNSGLNSSAECDPWKDWKEDDSTSEGLDGGGMCRMGRVGQHFNETCDDCHQLGHSWRYCPEMFEQGKVVFAAKKGSIARELLRVAVKIKVVNGAAMAAKVGTMERASAIKSDARAGSSVEKGLMDRASCRRA